MSRKGFEAIDGVRLKVRDEGDDLTATVWIDDEKQAEVLRSPLIFVGKPGSKGHHLFVDTASTLFNAWIGSTLGVEGVRSFRQEPNYKGE